MNHRVTLLLTLGVLAMAPPSFGDEALKPPAQATNTERFDFEPGGVIRLNDSFGDLYVEGWDQPQVEMTVTKTMPYEYAPGHSEIASRHLDAVRVVGERRSPSELVISTSLPPNRGLPRHPLAPSKTGGVGIEYQIHVPRNSRLIIHHRVGLISITDVTGDIEATCHRGDIMLWLPDTGVYSIDAKNRLGKVSSDFAGDSFSEFLVGQKFESVHPPPSQRLSLHMGFGGITIKPILPESETSRSWSGSTK
jgi:hypothetical protein